MRPVGQRSLALAGLPRHDHVALAGLHDVVQTAGLVLRGLFLLLLFLVLRIDRRGHRHCGGRRHSLGGRCCLRRRRCRRRGPRHDNGRRWSGLPRRFGNRGGALRSGGTLRRGLRRGRCGGRAVGGNAAVRCRRALIRRLARRHLAFTEWIELLAGNAPVCGTVRRRVGRCDMAHEFGVDEILPRADRHLGRHPRQLRNRHSRP